MNVSNGTYAEMLTSTNLIPGQEWIVTSGTNVGCKYEYRGATFGWVQTHDASGAALVAEQGIIGGGMNETSEVNNYTKVRKECNLSVISKTTAVTIGGGIANDTHLMGLVITAALTGTCVITGFADSDGTAQSITLPAATPAGFKDFYGAKNAAGALTITCSNAADDNLVSVLWRPV